MAMSRRCFHRAAGGKYKSSMIARFAKMHGCGNDFVVFDERTATLGLTATRAAAIADRHTGIGCDQVISMEPAPSGSNADAFMRIRNPDGEVSWAFPVTSDPTPHQLQFSTGEQIFGA